MTPNIEDTILPTMQLTKTAVSFLVVFILLCASLYFLGSFSVRQSMILGLLAGYLMFRFWRLESSRSLRLAPHFVRIVPHWYQIFSDLELIATANEYDEIIGQRPKVPPEKYDVFRDGVRFTVLEDKSLGRHALIYSDDYNSFVSRVDFERSLTPLTLSRESEKASLRNYTPQFFVRGSSGTYELGLNVPEWWWERKRVTLNGRFKATDVFDTGTVRLTIATVPGSEFTTYWERVKHQHVDGDEVWRRHRVKDRAEFEWSAEEKPQSAWLEVLKHKYFEITHCRI